MVGNQAALLAEELSKISDVAWHYTFASHHEFCDGTKFGNTILWAEHRARQDEEYFLKLDGDLNSRIGAHRQGRCAVRVHVDEPLHVAIITVHLGFLKRGVDMLKELLEWSLKRTDCSIILGGDFNTYPEEGRNPENKWEADGRYGEIMTVLQNSGFLKVAGCGRPVVPTEFGVSPTVAVPISWNQQQEYREQNPCFITFPFWTDQGRELDSHNHQLDYFFVRPHRDVDLDVKQIVPVAAHGVSDHHGLLVEIAFIKSDEIES